MSEIVEPRIHKLALESNDFCNQPCGFCFATFQTPPEVAAAIHDSSPETDTATTLNTDEVKSLVIEPFAKMEGAILHFTGGDPFLRRDLPELVEYAVDKGLAVSVDTNCLVVTQARNRHLYERVVPQLFRIGIPIDTPNKSQQAALRSHRRAHEAPQQFLRIAQEVRPTVPNFPEIKVNTLVTGLNYQQVPAIVDILAPHIRRRSAQQPGLIGRWSIDKFLPMERGAVNKSLYRIDENTYRQTVAAARNELAGRDLEDIITGDQPKVNTTLIVSPQGIVYVPGDTEKQFAPVSVRNTPLGHIIGHTALSGLDEQYNASLGEGLHRRPQWEGDFISRPPW